MGQHNNQYIIYIYIVITVLFFKGSKRLTFMEIHYEAAFWQEPRYFHWNKLIWALLRIGFLKNQKQCYDQSIKSYPDLLSDWLVATISIFGTQKATIETFPSRSWGGQRGIIRWCEVGWIWMDGYGPRCEKWHMPQV